MSNILKVADLHIHTHFSDSSSSPQEVIYQAHQHGLNCIAITDHDTIDGILPTIAAAAEHNIEIITGVELSSEANNRDVRILGYGFNAQDKFFIDKLNEMQDRRIQRMIEMIQKLKM